MAAKRSNRGRPLKAEMENTSEKILLAAKQLFVEKGFAATSISDIAKKAQINQSLIYHHFGSKQDLWKKVKSYVLETYGKFESFLVTKDTSLRDFLSHIINQRAALYENNPDLGRMMLWQKLEDSTHSLTGGTNATPSEWREDIISLKEQGKIRQELEVDMIITLIANAITGIYLYSSPLYENVKDRQFYIDMLIDCLERAIKA